VLPTSQGNAQSDTTSQPNKSFTVSPPAINLPRGGGAVRGIGEKFAANPVTGTGSMSVPIATSPGRSGFGPQLNLSYDSGSGNDAFGFGWSLSIPAITRKTDKGLPKYFDATESDVFILSGAEDLVPVFKKNVDGTWAKNADGEFIFDDEPIDGYRVRRYRPRIEGLFARIERWTKSDGDVHWRSISKDNILTLYGKDEDSRIFDPDNPQRVFSWLICETRDDKGNAVIYKYRSEDGLGVDLAQAHERNRGERDSQYRKSNRYIKHIYYGNRVPLLDAGVRPRFLAKDKIDNASWMFEVVFDYGDHDLDAPKPKDDEQRNQSGELISPWDYRLDSFSSYRSGFEVRTSRLCQRVLMFHHFAGEPGVGIDCLVRSTDFTYSSENNPPDIRNPIYSFLVSVTQAGYKRNNGSYLKSNLPPVEFVYTQPVVQDAVEEVDAASLENLPIGVDGAAYQWTDLHGEGIPGVLTEQAGAWFYKRNISPISDRPVEFAPVERVAVRPILSLAGGQAQFMDLAGDGLPDLVVLDGPMSGIYEHDKDEGWQLFRPFLSRLNRDMRDPNLKFIDLDGDGHADVLISEDNVFVWHPSLAEDGFNPALHVQQALDEEKGPLLIFADGTDSIYLADLSGDGLTDLVRIRNGEVCYWPNLGYACFGAKISMDNAPWFDNPDQFDHKRIRLADIDGSGTTDIIYLHRDGVRLYFNQSGNSWGEPHIMSVFPQVNDVVSIVPTDLLGNGTACLVCSSPLPSDARRQMRYVNLMGKQKPHLLIKTVNNLGAETRVQYAPSTKFYLQDKYEGKPWITRLPFPVHVVARVETYDHISRNRFVSSYAYHHGYFDGEEREFRGFGMVEQWDTEEFNRLDQKATNVNASWYTPPVHTKTWFHTGAYFHGKDISLHMAHEYFGAPQDKAAFEAWAEDNLLDDTVLPDVSLNADETREACRSLKGAMLRQEVYADDDSAKANIPYTVTEQNFTIKCLQPHATNSHALFFTHAREAINYHYERNLADPRIAHTLTLDVDTFGNVLRSITVGYPRANVPERQPEQNETHLILTLNRFVNKDDQPDWYRAGLPVESRTYEVVKPPYATLRFSWMELNDLVTALVPFDQVEPQAAMTIPYEDWNWRKLWNPQNEPGGLDHGNVPNTRLRLIEHIRTLYRKNNLTGFSQLGTVESLALPGESYKLAFTPNLLKAIYVDSGKLAAGEVNTAVGTDGGYVHSGGDANWWIPSGQIFYSLDSAHAPILELTFAQAHFFLPHRYRDPFHTNTNSTESFATYDAYDLLLLESRDPLGNRVTVGERLPNDAIDLTNPGNDYRVLQPWRVMDPNRNRTQVAFDALGMVVSTAVMGKPEENPIPGDQLEATFRTDLTQAETNQFLANPMGALALTLLGKATTRIIYDLDRFHRSYTDNPDDPTQWLPPFAATLARETHVSELQGGQQTKIQISFSYSDGFGREIQKKIQAESGKVEAEDTAGNVTVVDTTPNLRWVGSGWTIFNNKGKPVRQYEPFFSTHPQFQFGKKVGVSPILFYDPVGRVVATLHPNHTYEKVVFGSWGQTTFDGNDTVTFNPDADNDVKGFFINADGTTRIPSSEYLPTWYEFRTDPLNATEFTMRYPDATDRTNETSAATKAAAHFDTPTIAHFDTLGRPFLTITHNKIKCKDHDLDGTEDKFNTHVTLDIEGNQREVRDAIKQAGDTQGRIVMRYDYDMLGNRIHQASMEAGERWTFGDVVRKPLYAWDSRNHELHTTYDALRRPTYSFLREGAGAKLLVGRTIYGETQTNPEANNLRGKVVEFSDQAGVVTSDQYDFKGNLRRSQRQLAQEYKSTLNWSVAVPLETETFTSRTTYDALNRPVQLIAPHSDKPNTKINIIQPSYNEANLLEQVHSWLNQIAEPVALLNQATANMHAITDIDYDAKGQRELIDYGNGVRTSYTYDPLTFRLVHLLTQRDSTVFPADCPEPPPNGWPGCQVQNLHYTYDPVGNITHIRDEAQQTIYFRNKLVEPNAEYTYDAIYRLIEAKGREHLGQIGGAPIPYSYKDASRTDILSADAMGNFSPNDGNAMGTYIERYVYDAVGNFLEMQHRGSDPAHPGWTRGYTYNETSLIEDGIGGNPLKTNNRLSNTSIGNNPPVEQYTYDGHGNMIRMPHLGGVYPAQNMYWDYRDQLSQTDLGGGGTAYYVYDAAGQRVRKVWEKTPYLIEERIYLGGFEIFRRLNGGRDLWLERETLHIMDDKQRIALIETRTFDLAGNDPAPEKLTCYQFGNHLGSASLQLDNQAQIISYEEYTPYGSTSYQAVRNQTETPKRYRFTGKERDEESGLYYHGARYYIPWLARWIATDKVQLAGDSLSRYAGMADNPIRMVDRDGNENSLWDDAVEGSREITDAVHHGSVAVGDKIVDKASEDAAALEKAGHSWLASAVRWKGIIDATVTSTVLEVAGQTLAAGPNAVLALQRGGENIGTGAARIWDAEDWTDATLGGLEILAGAGEGASAALTFMPAGRPAAPRPLAPGKVPGRVQSRINMAEKPTRFHPEVAAGKPMKDVKAGMNHLREGHVGGTKTDSQFLVEPESVLTNKSVIKTEARPLPMKGKKGMPDVGMTYARNAETGTAIGRTQASDGGRLTNAVRVQTDAAGNVITAYPVPGWRAEFNIQMSSVLMMAAQRELTNSSGTGSGPNSDFLEITPAELQAQQCLLPQLRY